MPRFAHPHPKRMPLKQQVDTKNLSAAYKLFNNRYQCMTAQINLYSKGYLSTFGMVSTGDKKQDAAMANYPVSVWLSPAAMAQFLDEGATFGLVNRKDALEIYNDLNQHLLDWKHRVQFEINKPDVPWEDLKMFENLAKEMYPIAKGFMTNIDNPFDIFSRRLEIMPGLNRRLLPVEDKGMPGPALPETHPSVLDALRKELGKNEDKPKEKVKPWLQSNQAP